MSRIKNENFVVIQGFMVTELGLSGNELLAYAVIYGFTQTAGTKYTGSAGYIAEWLNCSKQTVYNVLNSLVSKGLVEKFERCDNGVKFCDYAVKNLDTPSKNLSGVVKNFEGGVPKNFEGGSQNFYAHNIEDRNISDNIEDTHSAKNKNAAEAATAQVESVVQKFNCTCKDLPKIKKITESRKKAILARIQDFGYDAVIQAFDMVDQSDFLSGRTSSNWQATLDWILKPANMTKILEGNYKNRISNTKNSSHSDRSIQSEDTSQLLAWLKEYEEFQGGLSTNA